MSGLFIRNFLGNSSAFPASYCRNDPYFLCFQKLKFRIFYLLVWFFDSFLHCADDLFSAGVRFEKIPLACF